MIKYIKNTYYLLLNRYYLRMIQKYQKRYVKKEISTTCWKQHISTYKNKIINNLNNIRL